MSSDRDQATLEALKSGSDDAFKKVYSENRERFIGFARKYGIDDESIVDIYQDAYIVFHENIMSGKLKVLTSSVSSYLFSIGKYKILEALRKYKKTVAYAVKDDVAEDVPLGGLELETQEMNHEKNLLYKHFQTLGEQCQKILSLFYYRGLDIEEIVKIGNYANKNTVKSQKSRCLRMLKEKIKSA